MPMCNVQCRSRGRVWYHALSFASCSKFVLPACCGRLCQVAEGGAACVLGTVVISDSGEDEDHATQPCSMELEEMMRIT